MTTVLEDYEPVIDPDDDEDDLEDDDDFDNGEFEEVTNYAD